MHQWTYASCLSINHDFVCALLRRPASTYVTEVIKVDNLYISTSMYETIKSSCSWNHACTLIIFVF